MKRRLIGLAGLIAVLALVLAVFAYAPQKDAPPDPLQNVSVNTTGAPEWFGQPDMVAAGLMPMVRPVKCFKRNVDRRLLWGHWYFDDNFRAAPLIKYRWCHNLRGRDWAKAYHISVSVIFQMRRCKYQDGGTRLRGFNVRFTFKDKYRKSKQFVRGMFIPCSKKGYVYKGRYLSARSTRRQYNVKHYPPWAYAKVRSNYTVLNDSSKTRRLPMTWYSRAGGTPL